MLTLISCPTCQHKFAVPEAAMGERQTCPNCQSIFRAGKSVAETDGRGKRSPLLKPALDRTMLAETEAPIRYNCPRCKKALESPASEAGMKKPCPACTGRLQVPAAPTPSSADPTLNRTMLASDESHIPQSAAPTITRTAAVHAPVPPTVTPGPTVAPPVVKFTLLPAAGPARTYAIGGIIAAGVLVAFLLVQGRSAANADYERALVAQKAELEKLKADMEQKDSLMREIRQAMLEKQKDDQRKLDDLDRKLKEERDSNLRYLASLEDKSLRDKEKARLEKEERAREEEKQAAAKRQADRDLEFKLKLEALERERQNAKKQETVIISQPAPVHPGYYYPWHPRYHPWGW